MKCKSEILFPYLRCGECGWIPQGAYRDKAIKFAKKYINKNKERETELRIILEEEAKETLHTIPEKRKEKKKDETSPESKRKIIILGILTAIITFALFGLTTGQGLAQIVMIGIAAVLILVFTAYAIVMSQRKYRK